MADNAQDNILAPVGLQSREPTLLKRLRREALETDALTLPTPHSYTDYESHLLRNLIRSLVTDIGFGRNPCNHCVREEQP